jgi:hypothetical protein
MTGSEVRIQELDDVELLARRAKIRQRLEDAPDGSDAPALISEYADLTTEFDKRARAQWAKAVVQAE